MNLFNQVGALQQTLPPVDLKPNGMFVSDDIRMTVPGTFGQITIEVEDLDTQDYDLPRIVATSLVESTTGPFAGFLPGLCLASTHHLGNRGCLGGFRSPGRS